MQGQVGTQRKHLLLVLRSKGPEYLDAAFGRRGQRLLKLLEKLRRRIGKRIASQRGQRQSRNIVHRTPQHGFHQEQRIPSPEKNGLVGRGLIGNVLPCETPMLAIEVGQRNGQLDEGGNGAASYCCEELFDGTLLGRLPNTAGRNVDRLNASSLLKEMPQQDCAIQAAAEQNGCRYRGGF